MKYRPVSFDTVIGQGAVVELLRDAVCRGKVPQQLLFSGRSGLGKTTIARILAASLLCETALEHRVRGDACGECASCIDALTPGRQHPDLIEFDAASYGGKDEVREIASRSHVSPMRSPVKVYIIDEAHGLSNPGGQAFLKLLEEPPPHVIFMLCTTDPQKMLKTNRGRCVELELLPPSREELAENLRRVAEGENWRPDDRVLDAVLSVSDPDLGVRGTVATLAKLGMALEDGGNPSDEVVAGLLGTPPPKAVARLFAAISQLDRVGALAELVSLRTVSPDPAVRAALARWCTERVHESLGGDQRKLELAVWRLEQVLAMGPEREWLDVTVAKLAAPESAAPPEALIAEARAVMAELRQATSDAARAVAADSSEAQISAAAAMRGPSPEVAQLLAAASPVPAGLAEVLAACTVTVDDGSVTIVIPSPEASRIAPFNAALKAAASRLGLSLRLRRAG